MRSYKDESSFFLEVLRLCSSLISIGKEFQRRGAAAAHVRSPRVGKVLIANGVSRIVLLDRSPYLELSLRETS